jgi:DnaD/phage-associated family protein
MAGLTLEPGEVQKLLGAASGDAALVFLHLRAHGHFDAELVKKDLRMTPARLDGAVQSLRQLGLFPEALPRVLPPSEGPVYSEQEVAEKLRGDNGFGLLVGEAQRRMGRILSTTDLKILLGLYDYLGLPLEVIGVLITFCIQRASTRGDSRRPSMRAVEQEGYRWADQGIDTVEAAAAYMQQQLDRQTALGRIKRILQIHDRKLTASEQNYVGAWLDMGFSDDAIALAYDRTCLNTGSMKWPYCNSILKSWASQGLLTAEQIQKGDQKQARPNGPQGRAASNGTPGQYEREAVARLHKQRSGGV